MIRPLIARRLPYIRKLAGPYTASQVLNGLLVVFVLGFIAYLALPTVAGADNQIFLQTVDDAFYYLNVAWHIVRGDGSTFDGLNPTNGYQPLWMLILLPVYLVAPDKYAALRLVNGIQLLALALAIFLVIQVLHRALGAGAVALAVPLFFWRRFIAVYVGGVESALLVLVLAGLLWYITRTRLLDAEAVPPRRWLALGILFGLLILTRFDYAWFVVAFYLYRLGRARAARDIRPVTPALWALLPVAGLVGPYLLFNLAVFGHLLPISAAMKSAFPFPASHIAYWNTDSALREYSAIAALSLAALVGLARFGARLIFIKTPALTAAARWFCLGIVLHYIVLTVFDEWGVSLWYFSGYIIGLVLLAGVILAALAQAVERHLPRVRALAGAGAALGILGVVVGSHYFHAQRETEWRYINEYTYETARWINTHLPPGAVAAMSDAGVVGYFSHIPIINLDGLANSYAYQDRLRQGAFRAYLQDHGARYIIRTNAQDLVARSYTCVDYPVQSRLYKTGGGAIPLCKAAEVFRSQVQQFENGHQGQVIIWAVDP